MDKEELRDLARKCARSIQSEEELHRVLGLGHEEREVFAPLLREETDIYIQEIREEAKFFIEESKRQTGDDFRPSRLQGYKRGMEVPRTRKQSSYEASDAFLWNFHTIGEA